MNATFLVQDVYRVKGKGAVIVGTVVSGTIKLNMKAIVSDQQLNFKAIEKKHKKINEVMGGEKAGIVFSEFYYHKLKSIKSQHLRFSDDANIISSQSTKPPPIEVKGIFGSIGDFFKAKKSVISKSVQDIIDKSNEDHIDF